jgi:hypothetical protein
MRPIPPRLAELRRQTERSYAWRTPARVVSHEAWLAMTDRERSKLSWRADPRLLEQLVEAEQKFTATFAQ